MLAKNIFKFAVVCACILSGTVSGTVFWPCESSADCTAEYSTCSATTALCECSDFESVFSGDLTKCLKTSLFGDTCEDTLQCNLMPSGANCKSGVCDCADGYTYVRGRCRLLNGLDNSCETDLDCYFGYDRESVKCHNNVCECADGYYHRNGNICRRKSMEIDDACVVDTDCAELGTQVKCISLKCIDESRSDSASSSKTVLSGKTLTKTETETETENHIKSPNTETENTSQSLSKSTSISSKDTLALVNGRNELTDDTETETEEPEQTQRSREIAVQTSIDVYELKPLTPQFKNVGTTTATTSTSTSSRRLSQYRRRLAHSYRFDDEEKTYSTLSNTDEDVEAGRNYGSACAENGKPCVELPHSLCSNGICFCKQGYYPKNGKCFAELGEIAESADECEHTFDNLSQKCICQKNYFYERNLRACRKPIQYHLSCTSNSQCSPYGASFCHPEIPRRCTCEQYAEYDALRQMCIYKQGLGAQCESNDGCPVANSICTNQLCVCKANFFEKDGACARGIGAECDADIECGVDDSVCDIASPSSEDKDKSCQCKKGYVHFKDECLKEAEEIEDDCIDTEQCKPLLGTCIEKKCSCTPEQHFKFGRCEERKSISEPCARAGECFVEKEPENVECRNSVCQCKFGFHADEEHKQCIRVLPSKKNSSGRPSALKIITFLLIGTAFLITSAAIKQAYYT